MTGRMVSVSADSLAAVLPLLDEALAHGVSGRHPVADARAEITLALDQPDGDLLAWAEVRTAVLALARQRIHLSAEDREQMDNARRHLVHQFHLYGLDPTDGTTGKAALVALGFARHYAEIGVTQDQIPTEVAGWISRVTLSAQFAVAMCAPAEVRTR